ncbi:MAG: FGGY-family carbohydrate kinase [Acidimicrobiales bacterium]|nr:FGGY-family carbohydrate kinase [Acidimicrobiales bacterium]
MDGHVVLAVDLGTGGPKTALVDLSGEVLDARHQRVEPTVGDDGTGTQDPDAWWAAIEADTRALTADHPDVASRLVAVAVTGQWGSTVPVDAEGRAMGDCLLWMDTRGGPLARAQLGGRVTIEGFAPRKAVTWIQRAGGAPSPEGNDPLGHRLWIREHEPEVYERTATFLEPIDYVNACFTGRVAASPVSMLLSWLTDNRALGHAAYDEALVQLAGVDPAKLPPLEPTMSVVGHVQPSVAADLGLPDDLPVVTALPDLHSAALGSGGIEPYEAHLSISTSAWIGCHTPDKKTSLGKQMATVPSALPGRYLLANNHETAGVCVEWARGVLVTAEDGLTTPAASSLAELDAVAAAAPSGSGGVLFTPWLNGERSPVSDANLRGSFHNLSLSTERSHLVRAVLEGVAHNARWLLEASEGVLKQRFDDLRVIGGGATSDVWCQIHADVLGRPLERVAEPLLVNVRGAAFFAGLVLGLLDEHEIPTRVPVDRTFEPDPAARRVHDLLHHEFVGRAKADRDMYARLNGPDGLALG